MESGILCDVDTAVRERSDSRRISDCPTSKEVNCEIC